jgi:hypothetical protein
MPENTRHHTIGFRRTMLAAVLMAGTVAGIGPVLAQVPSAAADAAVSVGPKLSSPVVGGFATAGGNKGQWAFAMGPTGIPSMQQLRLIRANTDKSGAVGFMCARIDGGMQMAIVIPGADFTLGQPGVLNLTVGDTTNKLRVMVRKQPAAGQPPVFEASGMAIADILKAMGEVPDNENNKFLTISDNHGHSASFGLTRPRSVASESSEICSGWGLAAAALRPGAVSPAPTVPVPELPTPESVVHFHN